jgi:hypothetical protein
MLAQQSAAHVWTVAECRRSWVGVVLHKQVGCGLERSAELVVGEGDRIPDWRYRVLLAGVACCQPTWPVDCAGRRRPTAVTGALERPAAGTVAVRTSLSTLPLGASDQASK